MRFELCIRTLLGGIGVYEAGEWAGATGGWTSRTSVTRTGDVGAQKQDEAGPSRVVWKHICCLPNG